MAERERRKRKRKDRDEDVGSEAGWAAAEGGCCLLQVFAAINVIALLVFVPMMMM